jgi:hypothetical protein
MYRDFPAQTWTNKPVRGSYRVGRFLITRAKSRWHICARNPIPHQHFSTLGGAIAWCQQQSIEPDRVLPLTPP